MKLLLAIFIVLASPVLAQHDHKPAPPITDGAKHKYRNIRKDVAKLTYLVIEGANTEEEKAAAIFHWITDNIKYDVRWLNGKKYKYKPKHVLKKRKTICRGYDWLLAGMCQYAGIEKESVHGYIKHLYHRNDRIINASNHVWNMLKIDGDYAIVDATYGAGYVQRQKRAFPMFLSKHFGIPYKIKWRFIKQQDWRYFKSPPSVHLYSHHPDHPMWQLTHDTMSAAQFVKSPEALDVWFRTGYGNIDSIQFYDYKNRITEYQEAKAKQANILYVAKAAMQENRHNTFDMAIGYMQQSSAWIYHEHKMMARTNSMHIPDLKECDSTLRILDSASTWIRYTKSKLTPYTSHEIKKINTIHRKVIKENTIHQRNSMKQKSNVVRAVNQHKTFSSRAKITAKGIKQEIIRVKKIKTNVKTNEKDRTPIAKYLRQIQGIHKKRDSINALIVEFNIFKDTLLTSQQRYKLEIENNITKRANLKLTEAGARWLMHYSFDTILAETERDYSELERACKGDSEGLLALLQTAYNQIKMMRTLGKLCSQLYIEERTLIYQCKNIEKSTDWDHQLAETKSEWLISLENLNQLLDSHTEGHQYLYKLLKPLTRVFDRNHYAIKSENSCSKFAALNYSGYEKYWLRVLKNEYREIEKAQKADKKWVVNHKKEAEQKLREIERLQNK